MPAKPVPTKMTSADPRGTSSLERAFKKPKPAPAEQPTSGATESVPEHDDFSSDKDSEHKKYMKSDKPSSY